MVDLRGVAQKPLGPTIEFSESRISNVSGAFRTSEMAGNSDQTFARKLVRKTVSETDGGLMADLCHSSKQNRPCQFVASNRARRLSIGGIGWKDTLLNGSKDDDYIHAQ